MQKLICIAQFFIPDSELGNEGGGIQSDVEGTGATTTGNIRRAGTDRISYH